MMTEWIMLNFNSMDLTTTAALHYHHDSRPYHQYPLVDTDVKHTKAAKPVVTAVEPIWNAMATVGGGRLGQL